MKTYQVCKKKLKVNVTAIMNLDQVDDVLTVLDNRYHPISLFLLEELLIPALIHYQL